MPDETEYDMTESELRQPREHPVLCQRCYRQTWDVDALCGRCKDAA